MQRNMFMLRVDETHLFLTTPCSKIFNNSRTTKALNLKFASVYKIQLGIFVQNFKVT